MIDNPYNELNDHTFLIYVAQNDYMIDGYFLPEGERLMQIANKIKLKQMEESRAAMDRLAQLDEELGLND
jgi:hypothetical protein